MTDFSSGACWVNGQLVDRSTPSISAVDHAIVVGDGVFETLQVAGGTPFALTRHLARLRFSSDGLGLLPPDDDQVRQAVASVLDADPQAGLVRITWSSGAGPLGSSRGDGPGTLIVATQKTNVWEASTRVHLCPWTRNEHGALVGLKTTSYAENVLALDAAHQRQCSEALFLNTAGLLCEGTGTNLFVVVDGQLVTPPLSSGCLAGITRALVLEVTDAQEGDLHPDDLAQASEAFLTSSTRDVQAISHIDDLALPQAPGPQTQAAAVAFAEVLTNRLDP
ncbi:MAG: 4-amino-4-deoxychorismate lyase [Actinobacteria bacterium]|nr:4-amino-4-deoxychorismate lyase [Actinomycetota bacterium]